MMNLSSKSDMLGERSLAEEEVSTGMIVVGMIVRGEVEVATIRAAVGPTIERRVSTI